MPWQPAAIQSNRGTKLIEILRLSHKGNREIKSNVYPLARITNKLSVRWTFHPRPTSAKSTFDSRLLSTPFFLANNPNSKVAWKCNAGFENDDWSKWSFEEWNNERLIMGYEYRNIVFISWYRKYISINK